MRSRFLPEMINQFVSYKRANGYQYQTGAYYLKKYAHFVMETAPETAAPDKKSVEGFLERLRDTREAFIMQPHPGVSSADILPPAALRHILSRPEGCAFLHRSSRISLRKERLLHSSGNATE